MYILSAHGYIAGRSERYKEQVPRLNRTPSTCSEGSTLTCKSEQEHEYRYEEIIRQFSEFHVGQSVPHTLMSCPLMAKHMGIIPITRLSYPLRDPLISYGSA